MPAKATYRTSDFTEIIFLMAHSIALLTTERSGDGDRINFVFDDSDGQCGAMVHDYMLGRDEASVVRVIQARQKALKIINMT